MPATQSTDFVFNPKVWSDHTMAYWVKKLIFGQLGVVNRTLTTAPGNTINFPYYGNIGAAEQPLETDLLSVDKLTDDSFSCVVKEIGKAVGFKKAAFIKSAESQAAIMNETSNQIARVLAEKVETDIIAEINGAGNFTQGFTAAAVGDVATVSNILKGKIDAFGDRHNEATAIVMHSQCFLNMMKDTNTGLLKADANDPMYLVEGFEGRLLKMGLIINDNVPEGAAIGGKKTYQSFIFKPNAFGLIVKEDAEMEMDKDILARELIVTGTQWYGVKSFHAKASAQDKRVARLTFATEVTA